MALTLYYHPLSSFCHKVLIALYEKGIDFDKRIIDLGNEAERTELLAVSPFGKFPVIRDPARDRNVTESTIIIEYLDHFHAGKSPLIPREWDQALEVRLWDRMFDTYVHIPMQEIVADRIGGSSGDTSKHRATLHKAYAIIEEHLASTTWAAGPDFSMADCAASPALFYASTLEPFATGQVRLRSYFERLMDRPSIVRVIEEAKPYFSLYPFADAIPRRFR